MSFSYSNDVWVPRDRKSPAEPIINCRIRRYYKVLEARIINKRLKRAISWFEMAINLSALLISGIEPALLMWLTDNIGGISSFLEG